MRIRSRIVLLVLVLAVPALAAVELLAHRLINGVVEDRTLARLQAESRLVGERVLGAGELPRNIDDIVDDEASALGLRITLTLPDGKVVGDSERDGEALARMENHGHRPEVVQALRDGLGLAVRHSDTMGVDMHYLATRLGPATSPVAILRLAIPSSEVHAIERGPTQLILVATILAIVAVGVLGYAVARRAAVPIESIQDIARSLARGESGAKALGTAGGPPEVEGITRSLETVGERLAEQVAALSEERNLLRTILAGMHEGLLIVDSDERVALANAHARAVFPGLAAPLPGRQAVEVVRDPEFLELLRGALGQGHEGETHLTLFDGRVLEIRVAPLEGPGLKARGALALILDVTRIERLESVRRDFVANVSHELRTPLSSIKAFVETLLDENGSDVQIQGRSFLEIVQRNATRMEDLINDLTDLSLIETGAISLMLEEVSARAVVEEVFGILGNKAEVHQVSVACLVSPEVRVWGDARRVTQVMLNLVDNAVKFCRPGGQVTVRAEPRGSSVALAVTDEGPGIAPEHRENIFHRFYRVPGTPERTGTGLGLAIVKHLMRLHGGTIDVESVPGKGSTFRVLFPTLTGS